jgi:hypothetical protein
VDLDGSWLRVARRFRGPPGAANGGFASGSLAALLGGDVEVSLRRPVPLERPLEVRRDGDGVLLLDEGGQPLAEARPSAGEVELTVPASPTTRQAHAAAGRAAYYRQPVFPECFVCGPARAAGDGLRILPGRVPAASVWTAPWTPDPSVAGADGRVRDEVVWAALDCPGGLAATEAAAVPADGAALLARMTARLAGRPRVGTEHQVVSWLLGRDRRKLLAGSALLGPGGAVLAAARALWVTVPRAALATLLGHGRGPTIDTTTGGS